MVFIMSFLPFFDNTVGPYLMYNFFQKLYITTNQILHYVREYFVNQGNSTIFGTITLG